MQGDVRTRVFLSHAAYILGKHRQKLTIHHLTTCSPAVQECHSYGARRLSESPDAVGPRASNAPQKQGNSVHVLCVEDELRGEGGGETLPGSLHACGACDVLDMDRWRSRACDQGSQENQVGQGKVHEGSRGW